MRLWLCKIGFNSPVTLRYGSFQVDTSVVVLFVSCLGVLNILCCWRLMYVFIFLVKLKVTEWPPIGKIAAHSAYEMFLWYKYLIVNLVFSHLGFWSGNLSLIAPFPDLCLLVPFYRILIF